MYKYARCTSLVITFSLALIACGGGGGSSGSLPNNGITGGGGTSGSGSGFSIVYTNTIDTDGTSMIPTANFFYDWYVENNDGSTRGPFDSNSSGVVDLGADSRAHANVTVKLYPSMYYTYVGVPVGTQRYYTGNRQSAVQQSIVINGKSTGQVKMVNDIYNNGSSWINLTTDPTSFTKNNYPYYIASRNNLVSSFISYRPTSSDLTNTQYAFVLDQPLSTNVGLNFNLVTPYTRTTHNWSSDTNIGIPCVIAERKGQLFTEIGDGADSGAMGSVGVPDQLPADHWYLADSCSFTSVMAAFDPLSTATINLRAADRYINSNLVYDSTQRTISFTLAPVYGKSGTDNFQYGTLQLGIAGTITWTIYFPWSMVTTTDAGGSTNVTVPLPALPENATLPAFTSGFLALYRIDDGATASDMLQYQMNQKENIYHPYASISKVQSW